MNPQHYISTQEVSKPFCSQYNSLAALQGKTRSKETVHRVTGVTFLPDSETCEEGGTFTWPLSHSATANPYAVHVTSAQLGDYRVELFLVKQDELLHNLSTSLTNTVATEDKHTGLNSLPPRAQGDD